MFETILNTESDKNPRNDYCTTPFHLICSNGNIKFAELLLRNLMPPTNTTSDIYDLVMIIHDNNLNLKSKLSDTGYSALMSFDGPKNLMSFDGPKTSCLLMDPSGPSKDRSAKLLDFSFLHR